MSHFKNIGFERTLKKQNALYNNLGALDVGVGRGLHLSNKRKKLRKIWDIHMKNCCHISWSAFNSSQFPNSYKWWRPLLQWMAHAGNFLRNPIHMLKRLKVYLNSRLSPNKNKLHDNYMGEINKSPMRKNLFQLTIAGKINSEIGNPVVIAKKGNGMIIQCLHSASEDEMPDMDEVKKILASKTNNEKKYNNRFKLIAITNSKKFSSNAMSFAKQNNIRLVCRKELLAFIASVETD